MRSDANRDSFQRALDEARRKRPCVDDGDNAEAGAPHIRADLGLPAREGSGKARFEEAMTWVIETPAAPAPAIASPASPAPEASTDIREELGLGADMTDAEMKRVWRAFVWRHHPDRQPPSGRLRAEARVAAANALYDRARRATARKD